MTDVYLYNWSCIIKQQSGKTNCNTTCESMHGQKQAEKETVIQPVRASQLATVHVPTLKKSVIEKLLLSVQSR